MDKRFPETTRYEYRRLLGEGTSPIPFYLVLGNHEGELGWWQAAGDSVVAWAEPARPTLEDVLILAGDTP